MAPEHDESALVQRPTDRCGGRFPFRRFSQVHCYKNYIDKSGIAQATDASCRHGSVGRAPTRIASARDRPEFLTDFSAAQPDAAQKTTAKGGYP